MAADFYGELKPFGDFARVVDDGVYHKLPEGWLVGIADVVNSTQAVQAGRYKAVNMAGAAVIGAILNALAHKPFAVVFGGDGARFAIAGDDEAPVRDALAKTACWARELLDLELRVALVPMADVRAAGFDVRVARFAASPEVSYANFTGRGMTWAEAQVKAEVKAGGANAQAYVIAPAPAGSVPDLTGLSCQWGPLAARRGLVLSLIVRPAESADEAAFAALLAELIGMLRRHRSGSPVPEGGPIVAWPRGSFALQAAAAASRSRSALGRWWHATRFLVMAWVLFKTEWKLGRFDPVRYRHHLALNTDFRKFDDALMMTVDCSEACADEVEQRLAQARADGLAVYGLHRQGAALITCLVPNALGDDHLHFLDGAEGGYTSAAAGLKRG